MEEKGIKRPKKAIVFILKVLLFAVLFCIFFGLFAIESQQLLRPSRTAAVTMITFVVLGIAMTAVYGGFAVGKKKSKEIIPSLCLAAFMTDCVCYLLLSIMETDEYSGYVFHFSNPGLLLAAIVLQVLAVIGFVYFGNFCYFKLNAPDKCVIICADLDKSDEMVRRVARYKKQYEITDVISYKDENLKALVRHADAVFLYGLPNDVKYDLIDYAYKHYTGIYIQTELSDIVVNYAKYTVLDDLALLVSTTKGLSLEQRFLKRLIDILFSGILLVIASPIMLIEALMIKLGDGGPVFYKQERLTFDGKKFNVLKFRTMIVDAEKKSGAMLSTKGDPRITPVGRFLRKTRMDELPQFINVLKGDMSIVGPRPEREVIAEEYYKEVPEFKYRLRAKAGLTGLAQISGKYNTSPKDKLMLDLMYIERYNVWMDLQLILQTLKVFFKRDSTEGMDPDASPAVELVKHDYAEETDKSPKQ